MEHIIECDSSDERESNDKLFDILSVSSVISSITNSSTDYESNDVYLEVVSVQSVEVSITNVSTDCSTVVKTQRTQRNVNDFVYAMINPVDRIEIIRQIDNGLVFSDCNTGRKRKWWTNKHYPKNPIPTNIYLLGYGTQRELHEKYIKEYGPIEWKEFSCYTRELIKQGIMY